MTGGFNFALAANFLTGHQPCQNIGIERDHLGLRFGRNAYIVPQK